MSSSRAYELIAIADGTKTVEGIREANAEANRRYRATPSRDGQPQPTDSIGKNTKVSKSFSTKPKNLGGRPVFVK